MDDLLPIPTIMAEAWAGYQHFTDPTIQPFNTLAYPSRNCTIPSFDKIVPDKAKLLLGQKFTQNSGIIGNKEKFTTKGGVEIEVRVWASEQMVTYDTLVGVFTIGETITGGTSGHTATVISRDTGKLILSSVSGPFTVGETITGGTSGATAVIVADFTTYGDVIEILYTDTNPSGAHYNTPYWYQITKNVNPFTRGVHRYSFEQWFDANLNPALSLNVPRLIWVNGLTKIFSWTGGIAPIISLVPNTSITTNAGVSWTSLGFVSPALGGSGNIIINGLSYAITGGWDTDTLTLTSTTGITAGNLAFSEIEQDDTTSTGTIPFDFCRQNKNYMYYGDWKARQFYQSNAFSHSATTEITAAQALQNDLVVGISPYTGTGHHVYRVTIDSVNPPVNDQTFASPAGGGLDDGLYNTSGYSGTPGALNNYTVLMLAELSLLVDTIVGTGFVVGDIVQGGTSNAQGVVVFKHVAGGTNDLGIAMNSSASFVAGESITDLNNGTTANVVGSVAQNYFQFLKNGAVVNVNVGTGLGPLPINPLVTTVITLTDGLSIQFSNSFGHAVGDVFKLAINQGGHDTFQWQIDGAAPAATFVAITGALQTLSLGVQISFVSITGHQVGDFWDITVDQEITEAWHNYYYTLPVRKPGEGYIYQLPSNFWTMDTQEEVLYVNTQFGEWSTIETILSSDLVSEKVTLEPLKQSGSLKVIDPWMTGHLEDDLMFVTIDKALMGIGRKAFLEKPQDGYLSDPVKLDFLASTFTGGSIKYIGKKLYISSPAEEIAHRYDVPKKYWQTPVVLPEVAILSIVGNDLITHSNIRNQSFTMFKSLSDNGQNYTVEARTPATPYFKLIMRKHISARWYSKYTNNTFIEGYITGAPPLVFTAYLGVNGCGGEFSHPVDPIICTQGDRAPIGEGSVGSHSLGSDVDFGTTYFNEIYTKYSPILSYYFIGFGLLCTCKSHTYSITSMGANLSWAPDGNNEFVNQGVDESED